MVLNSCSVGQRDTLAFSLRGLKACALPLSLASAFGAVSSPPSGRDWRLGRDALWQVVSKLCVAGSGLRDSVSVSSVDLQMGYAVLQVYADPILLVPTRHPRYRKSGADCGGQPNYWEVAWNSAQPPWTGKRHRGVEG